MSSLRNGDKPVSPIEFHTPDKNGKVVQNPIVDMNREINSQYRYAISRITENGRFVRGNMLFYSLDGVEVYTELNNLIFVDEANHTLFIKSNESVINEITPENPESKTYVVLYTDISYDEDNEVPLNWESYTGRLNTYEAIKYMLPQINVDRSLVLVDNVPLKDALTVRQFIEYLKNADVIDEELDLDEYE